MNSEDIQNPDSRLKRVMDNTSNSSNSSSASGDWEEEQENVTCLFCDSVNPTMPDALDHLNIVHNFDLNKLYATYNMDCYSFIKLINYIRKTGASPSDIMCTTSQVWDADSFLSPVMENDPWLQYDFEGYFASGGKNVSECSDSNDECHNMPQMLLHERKKELMQCSNPDVLNRYLEHFENVTNFTAKIAEEINAEADVTSRQEYLISDKGYFSSYSNPSIHKEMLSDKVRTDTYKKAIEHYNIKDKVVLDVGCGTGILSLFAATAGARKVYAVDNSDVIYSAMDTIRENNFENVIKPIRGCIEDENNDIEEVDVIVSEWMGYFLFFEGMLESVTCARQKYLKPGGIMLPSSCTLYLCGANDPSGYDYHLNFWSDVYGYRMSCIRNEVLKEAVIDEISESCIITTSAVLHAVNMYEDTTLGQFKTPFSLTVNKKISASRLTTLVGYFDVDFGDGIGFTTSPYNESTHWKQTLFHLPEPIEVTEGMKVDGECVCSVPTNDRRCLNVQITINGKTFCFSLK